MDPLETNMMRVDSLIARRKKQKSWVPNQLIDIEWFNKNIRYTAYLVLLFKNSVMIHVFYKEKNIESTLLGADEINTPTDLRGFREFRPDPWGGAKCTNIVDGIRYPAGFIPPSTKDEYFILIE